MSKAFGPFNIDLDSKRAPTETDFIQFMRDGVMQTRIYWDGNKVVFPPTLTRLITGGTVLTLANVSFTGNWGDSPTKIIRPDTRDSRGAFGIHTGPTNNPTGSRTVTLSFGDGPFAAAPTVLVQRQSGAANLTLPNSVDVSTTAITITVSNVGTPDVDDYFYFICAG